MEDTFHLGIKALIRNRKGEILLLKVNPKKLIYRDDWKGVAYWDIPGGRVKKGVSVEETFKREVKEETGISKVRGIKPFAMVLSKIRIPIRKSSVGLILAAYTCQINVAQRIILSEEHVEARWFSPRSAARFLGVKYPKEFTEKIKDI